MHISWFFVCIVFLIRDGNSSENFIPRGIEESRNDKFTFLGDRGISNLFLGFLEEFRGLSYPKNPENTPQNQKNCEKKIIKKIFSIEFILQSSKYSAMIPKIDRLSWKTEWKTEKSRQIAENLLIFSISRSSVNFGEDSRSRGVIKSIPRGIEEWKKVRDLEDRGTRNSSCHPYTYSYPRSPLASGRHRGT